MYEDYGKAVQNEYMHQAQQARLAAMATAGQPSAMQVVANTIVNFIVRRPVTTTPVTGTSWRVSVVVAVAAFGHGSRDPDAHRA